MATFPFFRIFFNFFIVSGGKNVLFVIISLRSDNIFNDSSKPPDVIFDNVDGTAARVVAL